MAKFRLLKVECPKCNTADNVRSIYDYERNLEIFQCKHCRESFAVRQEDVWNNGHDWVTQEWRNSYEQQRRETEVDA